ncbi:MAG TPA: hypothetical protein DCY13_00925 [Verrucomicrobiales bacterium]|nr:hypothetical protein [Verrucomicrobiales bacterium]
MNRRRKSDFGLVDELPTAVDYLVGGIAPLMIMVMVGSLVWFLQDLVYVGTHSGRLRWMMFWFVIGMVGIARIAMERSPAYAGIYALGLGFAVAVLMRQYFVMPAAGWLLLAVVWWCTHKLVWDCTLVDDEKDASGEGLLEIAGLDETAPGGERPPAPISRRRPPWWRRFLLHDTSPTTKPHPHGLWVIWFSLAALPLFGFGHAALIRMGRDNDGLVLIALYLVAAIGLLLTTSFLGLRRYLRQRRLKMPGAMAAGWLSTGAVILAVVVVLSWVIPRPVSLAANGEAANTLTGKVRDEAFTKVDERGEEPGNQSADEAASSEGQKAEEGAGSQQGQRGEGGADQGRVDSALVQDRPQNLSGTKQSPSGATPPWARWLGWLIVILAVLYVLIRCWRDILTALRESWKSICAIFEPKETRRRRRSTTVRNVEPAEPRARFADLTNPFADASSEPDTAVRETFAALEVWAAERGAARPPDATPIEFAQGLVTAFPSLGPGVRQLARLYAGLAYAERRVRADELPAVRQLWEAMAAGG